ncbi:hypothetical protein KKB40_02065, partial [Patescibacteria group bacterium]|nr:hypothetical protein [Patescibacteria group bacterium]
WPGFLLLQLKPVSTDGGEVGTGAVGSVTNVQLPVCETRESPIQHLTPAKNGQLLNCLTSQNGN